MHGNPATHQFHQLLTDRQTQSAAAEASRHPCGLFKPTEQALADILAHAGAGIGDLKFNAFAFAFTSPRRGLERDGSAFGELDRIVDQVEQHLLDAQGIPLNPTRQARIGFDNQLQPLFACQWFLKRRHLA